MWATISKRSRGCGTIEVGPPEDAESLLARTAGGRAGRRAVTNTVIITTAKTRWMTPGRLEPAEEPRQRRRPRRVAEQQRQAGERQPEEADHQEAVQEPVRPIEPSIVRVACRAAGRRGLRAHSPSSVGVAVRATAAPCRRAFRCIPRPNHSAVWMPKNAKTPSQQHLHELRRVEAASGCARGSCGSACGSYCAKLAFAPAWHFWHVATRLRGRHRRARVRLRAGCRARRGSRRTSATRAIPERRHLAVERVAVGLERLLVARAALPDDLELPAVDVGPPDVVRRVAVGADRRERAAPSPPACRARSPVLPADPLVALPARAGNVLRKTWLAGSVFRRMSWRRGSPRRSARRSGRS